MPDRFSSDDGDPLSAAVRALLAQFDPDPNALLAWLRPRIGDDMLAEIAAADYGMDLDEHLAALRRIRDDGAVLAPMGWEPKEVLELIRWSEPDDPTWKPGSTGERGHLMRTFACTALIRAAAEPANFGYFSGENQTVIQLIASVLTLGQDAQRATLQLLTWRVLREPDDPEERPFFALGVLLLAAALGLGDDGAMLRDLCAWVVAEEAWARGHGNPAPNADAWLLGVTWFSQRDATWREAGWRVLVEPPTPHPPAAQAALRDIATRLVVGYPDDAAG